MPADVLTHTPECPREPRIHLKPEVRDLYLACPHREHDTLRWVWTSTTDMGGRVQTP